MGNVFYVLYSLIYLALIVYAVRMRPDKDLQFRCFIAILAALFYDNFISCIGVLVGAGQVLKFLNFFRFAFHVFITPLLCFIAFSIARQMGVKIAQRKYAAVAVWVLIAVFIVMGFLHDIAPMDLTPKVAWGVLTYSHAEPVIPIPVILINVFVIINAVFIWKAIGWPVLFITSLAMFFIGAIQIESLGNVPGNAGEILFSCGFLAAQKKLVQMQR